MKVLGFVNGQVVSAVGWQATTVALFGIVIGLPLGVIAGRAAWKLFANHLGVIAVSVVPVWVLGALALGVLVVANLLAVGPALAAKGTKPGRSSCVRRSWLACGGGHDWRALGRSGHNSGSPKLPVFGVRD